MNRDHVSGWHEKFQPLGPALKTPRIEVDEKSAIEEFESRSFDHPSCTGGNAPSLSQQALVSSPAARMEFRVGDMVRVVRQAAASSLLWVAGETGMDGMVGHVFEIKEAQHDRALLGAPSGRGRFYFLHESLEHISQPSDTQQWVEWKGGERPVPPETRVEYRMRGLDLDCRAAPAGCLCWRQDDGRGDIVAYRVVPS